jgi:hypothetical protein
MKKTIDSFWTEAKKLVLLLSYDEIVDQVVKSSHSFEGSVTITLGGRN